MPRITNQSEQRRDFVVSEAYHNIYISHSVEVSSSPQSSSSPSQSVSRISPAVLLVIVILAVIFFISGLLYLLVRFLMKRSSSFSSISQSNRYQESSGSQVLPRQLQQLFRLHDSGVDQTLIDALPVFYYNEIMGLKEPLDCAVCLCEFSIRDMLRLLPNCSHAFHINCIDMWFLSNSTCPLCRDTLNSFDYSIQNPSFYFKDLSEQLNGYPSDVENEFSSNQKEIIGENSVLSVKLGKFQSLTKGGEDCQGETSRCNMDARRCYSLGSFQYVVDDSELQVVFSNDNNGAKVINKRRDINDMEAKKISGRSRGDSFSVSKVWLWSNKRKPPNSYNVSSMKSDIGQLSNITS